MLCKVGQALICESVHKILNVDHSSEGYFPVFLLFVTLCKVVVTIESVDEILCSRCHS